MCGIAGYTGDLIPNLLEQMIEELRTRGPDDSGMRSLPRAHLAHTRLSIIDIDGGHQPMANAEDTIVVSYNGEIYNYEELRRDLEAQGCNFRTTCDTELLPLGYAVYGTDFFKHLNGMFAFALYDQRDGTLHLVRDPFGIKPLYYAIVNDELVFASSARAITQHPGFKKNLRVDALRDFLQFRYVPDGQHFFEGIETVPPGTHGVWKQQILTLERFWDAEQTYHAPQTSKTSAPEDWVERIDALLTDSLRIQLRSDVPVGVFLSGGVDSSSIAHFAAKQSERPLDAFTFSMAGTVDETQEAARIAEACAMPHHVVGGQAPLDFSRFYDAIACMDMPVGDAIILPTYLLCEAAAKTHKVVLTGEGADEIFGGYVHYPALRKLDSLSEKFGWLRHFAPLVNLLPIPLLNRHFDYQASLGVLGRKKITKMIRGIGRPETLFRLASSVLDDDEVTLATTLPVKELNEKRSLSWDKLIIDGIQTWLPYQILNKMDQLSMAHGLEARVPFLDTRLYEAVSHAPADLLLNKAENKALLRYVLRKHGIANASAPKRAFHVPIEEMYRDQLTALCQEWLSPARIKKHGILKQDYIDDSLAHLAKGEFIASKRLFTMVALHMWLDANGGTL